MFYGCGENSIGQCFIDVQGVEGKIHLVTNWNSLLFAALRQQTVQLISQLFGVADFPKHMYFWLFCCFYRI